MSLEFSRLAYNIRTCLATTFLALILSSHEWSPQGDKSVSYHAHLEGGSTPPALRCMLQLDDSQLTRFPWAWPCQFEMKGRSPWMSSPLSRISTDVKPPSKKHPSGLRQGVYSFKTRAGGTTGVGKTPMGDPRPRWRDCEA